MVLSTAAIAGGSLFGPVIYSLFSQRQTAGSLIFISVFSLVVSLFMKVLGASVVGISLSRTMETVLGVGLPFVLLFLYELYAYIVKKEVPFLKIAPDNSTVFSNQEAAQQNLFGVKVIAWSTTFVGIGIALLGSIADNGGVAIIVGSVIILIAVAVLIKQYSNAAKRAELNAL